MTLIPQIIFILLLAIAVYFFAKNVGRIRRNILLGKDQDLTDQRALRWKTMFRVAFGQTKMTVRPIAAMFHFFIYVGFILINIEVLEIMLDGIVGTHRMFLPLLGDFYFVVINFFEILGALVLIACFAFLFRRYILKLQRFRSPELRGFPDRDAATILFVEILLMTALFIMNANDHSPECYIEPIGIISGFLAPVFEPFDFDTRNLIERGAWWFHFIGILLFMNYLPYSKHFHIILAFPNTWYSRLQPAGAFPSNASVTTEVKLMMDPSASPPEGYEPPSSFGVRDVGDLSWKNLMDAYTCTECGRCTSVCPANITGKKLSPRKIMMDTRDRLEEVGKNIDANLIEKNAEKDLHAYITAEELWACTTCNACVEACPVNISPVEIIMGMRQYLVMEKSEAPAELNMMLTNIENNGAPWQFSPADRGNWAKEI